MRWDARSKLLLVLAVAVTYSSRLPVLGMWYLILGLSTLFFLASRRKLALWCLAGFCLWFFVPRYWHLPSWLDHLFAIHYYIWPSLWAGHFLLVTTSSYELVHALRKWHFPEFFLITLAVMFRFLPAIRKDATAIVAALRVRGIFVRKRDFVVHPLQVMTYFLVPLLFSLLKTAQELTVASLTKGLASHVRPVEYVVSTWSWLDWSLSLWCLSLLLFNRLF